MFESNDSGQSQSHHQLGLIDATKCLKQKLPSDTFEIAFRLPFSRLDETSQVLSAALQKRPRSSSDDDDRSINAHVRFCISRRVLVSVLVIVYLKND